MKRDMELMRKILFAIEERYTPGEGIMLGLPIEGYEIAVVAEHCKLLYQSGILNDYNTSYADDGLLFFRVGNLSNYGYDYLELVRNDEVWSKTKKKVEEKKLPQTIEWIATIAGKFFGSMASEMM